MKKLLLTLLLVLGGYQTITPAYAKMAAMAAKWGMSKAVVGGAVVNAALFGAFSHYTNKPLVNALTNPEFQEAIGMKQPDTWLPYLWNYAKWAYSEFGAAIGILSMAGSAVSMANSARNHDQQVLQQQYPHAPVQQNVSHEQFLKQNPQYQGFLRA